MKHKSARAKGKILEKWVADQIKEKGIDPKAYPSHGSGSTNREKADIWTSMMVLGQNAGIEVKNQQTISIPAWWRQTKQLESLSREPILVFKIPHDPLEGTLAVVYLDTLLELIKLSNTDKVYEEITPEDSREKKYKIQKMIYALKDLEKEYE